MLPSDRGVDFVLTLRFNVLPLLPSPACSGLRFLFTIRSKTPELLKEDGTPFFGDGYTFVPGKDDVLRTGTAGYVVTFGDCAYRAIDAVDRLRAEGIDVGLIVKCTINVVDEETTKLMGESPFVLVVRQTSTSFLGPCHTRLPLN